ncbi:putative enzyme related to lactoylglutathione lyase [Nocardiopsis arvandica]|uniref:Putative enzyme related to lactoylglutathione lyase n=1 Tax=Nocardiopsis sinuspersici TaxID=501010 RepID=A0A7Y9XGR3_9ACTN|nr:VOC family protein [Nocardiopsis sinuspersici]NYH55526.1 putative enzyme related to lactoylglutathione lyase [Nocardiopsis sinuspersici]
MGSRLQVIAIDAIDIKTVAAFWSRVLDWPIVEEVEDGISLAPADGATPEIEVFSVPERKTVKNRLHLDLRVTGGLTVAQEVDRLLGLGAVKVDVGQPQDAGWTVLADPEGNEFCLLHGRDDTP